MEITVTSKKKEFEPITVTIEVSTEKELDTLIQLMSIHEENSSIMNELKSFKTN